MANETAGLECYEEVGFTKACAAVWSYDTVNTMENCLNTCLAHVGKPPNLDAEDCPLNDCILCNEVKTGPYFKKYAGRTRRGSGLMSYIVRNCSELVDNVSPLDPCPNGYTPGKEEESYPKEEVPGTQQQSSSQSMPMAVLVVASSLVVFLVLA